MNKSIKNTLATLVLVAGSTAIGAPAFADNVTVSVGAPGIAFGYNDGYWDRGHSWHAWRNQDEATRWRAENRDHYFAWKHDRDHDQGWREADRWWDRH